MKRCHCYRLAVLACAALLLFVSLILPAGNALAGWNEVTVAAEGNGIAVYSSSSGSKKVGILYNGYNTELALEPTHGRYSCFLTRECTVWLNQEKAESREPRKSDYADYDDWQAHRPCSVFLAEITQDNTPVYISLRHKHETARHMKGTLVSVWGEFGDDYYVRGPVYGFVSKDAVRKIADMTYLQAHSSTYIYDDLPKQTLYGSETEPSYAAATAAGYNEETLYWAYTTNREVTVLRDLGDWVQLAGHGFVEKRFLDPEGDHSFPAARIRADGMLDRVNIRSEADTDSTCKVKLCSGVPVRVVSSTDTWAVVMVAGPGGGSNRIGCVMKKYISFDSQDTVRDGTTQVRLTQDLRGNDDRTVFRENLKGDVLPAGTLLTVVGVFESGSSRADQKDRFLCETEDGRYVEIESGGILEPVSDTGITAAARSAVKMRQAPDPKADVIRQIKAKTKVEVLLRGEIWTLVRYKGETGYMMSRYLSFP